MRKPQQPAQGGTKPNQTEHGGFRAPGVPPADRVPPKTRDLTAAFVDTITVSQRTDFADATVPGLSLRVTPTGAKSWALRYRVGGRVRRLTLGTVATLSLADARARARSEWKAIGKGADPATAKRDKTRGHTIADLATDYLADAKTRKRSWAQDDRILEADVLPKWRARRAADITRRDVRSLLEAIATRAPIAANRALALVRAMFNFGIRRDWVTSNPAALIEKPGTERSRDRVLTDDEIRRVWHLADMERPTMAAFIQLRLVTAQRGGELAQLRWVDVEADAITIPADVAKNGLTHRVPLTQTAQGIMETIPRGDDSPWVFPGRSPDKPMGDAKKAGQRMQDRMTALAREQDPTARVDFRGHDLRRTAATRMASVGVPQQHISRVLNHVDRGPRATQVYQRYEFDKEKRIALEAWDRELQRILTDQPQTGKVAPFTRGAPLS